MDALLTSTRTPFGKRHNSVMDSMAPIKSMGAKLMFFMLIGFYGYSRLDSVCAVWNALTPSSIPFTSVRHLRNFHRHIMRQQLLLTSRVNALQMRRLPTHPTFAHFTTPIMTYTEAEAFCRLMPVFGCSWSAMAAFWNVCVEKVCDVIASDSNLQLSVAMRYKSAADLQTFYQDITAPTSGRLMLVPTNAPATAPLQVNEPATSVASRPIPRAQAAGQGALLPGQLSIHAAFQRHKTAAAAPTPSSSAAPTMATPSTSHPLHIPCTSVAAAAAAAGLLPSIADGRSSSCRAAPPAVGDKRPQPPDPSLPPKKQRGPAKGSHQNKARCCNACKARFGVAAGPQVEHVWQNCPLSCQACSKTRKKQILADSDDCVCKKQ
jgi:hypothetical protein